jgi:uncharacterized protein YndB with AHSA1/START domain
MADRKRNGSKGAPSSPQERAAPVATAREIEIAAAPEDVWDVLTSFERWPSWNPDVKAMSTSGPPAVGSTFRWKAGPGTITSTIRHLDAPRRIAWTGRTLGFKALDSFQLQPSGPGTLVREEEWWDGLVARLFRRPLQRTLDRSIEDGLRHLKVEVERTESLRRGS